LCPDSDRLVGLPRLVARVQAGLQITLQRTSWAALYLQPIGAASQNGALERLQYRGLVRLVDPRPQPVDHPVQVAEREEDEPVAKQIRTCKLAHAHAD